MLQDSMPGASSISSISRNDNEKWIHITVRGEIPDDIEQYADGVDLTGYDVVVCVIRYNPKDE